MKATTATTAATTNISHLTKHGLNLFSVLDPSTFPPETLAFFTKANVPIHKYNRLVLIGNGGRAFWSAFQKSGMLDKESGEVMVVEEHPMDTFSEKITREFIQQELPHDLDIFWLFPDSKKQRHLAPLQQLGILAGWGDYSPLGIGISPDYGLWYAYRAAFLAHVPQENDNDDGDDTNTILPLQSRPLPPSPCLTCVDKPCQTQCPAMAVQIDSDAMQRGGDTQQSCLFQGMTCAKFRYPKESPCRNQCLSRKACPIAAPEHQYEQSQIEYHYGKSVEALRKWYDW